MQYRNAEGRTRRLTVGLCGRLTPEEARRMARQLFAAVERGEDPTQDLQDNRRAPTVAQFAVQYMELHARPKKKPRSVEKDEAILRLYIVPALGPRKLSAITAADVARPRPDSGSARPPAGAPLAQRIEGELGGMRRALANFIAFSGMSRRQVEQRLLENDCGTDLGR